MPDIRWPVLLAPMRSDQLPESHSPAFSSSITEQELPPLMGSEKQVEWAVSIRRATILNLPGNTLYDLKKHLDRQEISLAAALLVRTLFVRWLSSHTEARWWIDHREEYGNPTLYDQEKFLERFALKVNELVQHPELRKESMA